MSGNCIKVGVVVMKIKHLEWRNGLAFYRRRVPRDVQKKFGRGHLFFSLSTRDPIEAAKRVQAETTRLEREWQILRNTDTETASAKAGALGILRKHDLKPGQAHEYRRFGLEPDAFVNELLGHSVDEDGISTGIDRDGLPMDLRLAADLFYADPEDVSELMVPTFSEVVEKHLYFFPRRKTDDQFHRSIRRFLDLNGDLLIDQYRRSHGNAFVEDMRRTGLKKATIKRYLNQVRPVFETAIVELEVSMSNPLSKLKVPDDDCPTSKRGAFTPEQIRAIQTRCREINDPARWCIALLSDSGARLSEIAGLKAQDVMLNDQVPHVLIAANELRGLKTPTSERRVPLVGEALWAANQALVDNSTPYLFPAFVHDSAINSGSISATLNKWLIDQSLREKDQPLHSFRHSLRDRLRNIECPPDVADRIGGWKRQGVGESYGMGHDLRVLQSYMVEMIKRE